MCVSWVPAKIVCKLNCIVNELFVCKLTAYRATPAHPRYFPLHCGGQTNCDMSLMTWALALFSCRLDEEKTLHKFGQNDVHI